VIDERLAICRSCPKGHFRDGVCQVIRRRYSCANGALIARRVWETVIRLGDCPVGCFPPVESQGRDDARERDI